MSGSRWTLSARQRSSQATHPTNSTNLGAPHAALVARSARETSTRIAPIGLGYACLPLAEMTRVRRNNEEKARERERHTCDDQPRSAQLQLRNLRGDEPDAREEDQQEPNFRDSHTSVSRHGNDGVHLSQSAADFGHTHGPRATTQNCLIE